VGTLEEQDNPSGKRQEEKEGYLQFSLNTNSPHLYWPIKQFEFLKIAGKSQLFPLNKLWENFILDCL